MHLIKNRKIFLVLVFTYFFLLMAPSAGAFFVPDLLKPVTDLFQPKPAESKDLQVNSSLKITEGPEINNKLDSGEIIHFTYTIDNPTDKKFKRASLKTNIKKSDINFIHEIFGATGIKEIDNTILFTNLNINPYSQIIIGFKARVNHFSDQDKIISTQPELLTSDKKLILKSESKEIKALKKEIKAIKSNYQINQRGTNEKSF